MNARLERLLPRQADNRFDGHRSALWLLGLFIALKIVMGVNSIFNTESVAVGADGIPLDSYSPAAVRQVLMLFALTSLGQLMLALVGLTVHLGEAGRRPWRRGRRRSFAFGMGRPRRRQGLGLARRLPLLMRSCELIEFVPAG